MFRIMRAGAQVGRVHKTLDAAERAVQKTYGAKLSGSGTDIVTIVDTNEHVLRVYYIR